MIKLHLLTLFLLSGLSLQSQSGITADEAKGLVEEYLYNCLSEQYPDFYRRYFDIEVEEDQESLYTLYQNFYQYKIHSVRPPWVEVIASYDSPEMWDRMYRYKLVKKEDRLFIVPKENRDWYSFSWFPYQVEQKMARPFTTEDTRYFKTRALADNGLEESDMDKSYSQLLGEWVVKESKGYQEVSIQNLFRHFHFKPDGKFGQGGDWFVADSLLFIRFPDLGGYKKFEMYPVKGSSIWLALADDSEGEMGLHLIRPDEGQQPAGSMLHPGLLPRAEILLQPMYEELFCISPNRIIFERYAKAGLMDTLMQVIIPAEYDKILADVDDQMIFAVADDRTQVYDSTGHLLRELDFKVASPWLDGQFFIDKKGKKGIMDSLGHIVIAPVYDGLKPGSLTAYKAFKGGQWGLIGLEGKELIPFEYDDIAYRTKQLSAVQKGQHYGVINIESGELIVPIEYDRVEIRGAPLILAGKSDKTVIFRMDGTRLSDEEYDLVAWIGHDYIGVEKEGKRGVINEVGEMVLPIEYDNVMWADHTLKGLFEVRLNDEEVVVDSTGAVIDEKVLEEKRKLARERANNQLDNELYTTNEDHIIPKRVDGEYAFFDSEGQMVIPPVYEGYPVEADDGFIVEKYLFTGMIDWNGAELLPFIFQDIYECSHSGLFIVEYQGKKGIVRMR